MPGSDARGESQPGHAGMTASPSDAVDGRTRALRGPCWRYFTALLLSLFSLAACAQTKVHFNWFQYSGRDHLQQAPLPPGHYRNPVLAGFYPDPSVIRVGTHYYLVNSTFAWFPGLPIFESTDLVHWTLIGHVIDRASQLNLDGMGVSRGLFAATLAHHAGVYYVVGTEVDGGGNFIVSARNPAGPWSDPVWLKHVNGIDPSLFFDDDDQAYLLNNGPPEAEPQYPGHRAIWMQRFDLSRLQPFGPRRVVLNGGADLSYKPVWIEGPHLYKRQGWYYLSAAEGGTGPQHSQVVLRSRSLWGPYQAYAGNPILSQRDLPAQRADPVTNAGHADLIEASDGSWWAVFLASRSYAQGHYNTGRETWLLPVHWQADWPLILPAGQAIPRVVPAPAMMHNDLAQAPMAGNFIWRDEFDQPRLDPTWSFLRAPQQTWWDLNSKAGALSMQALHEGLDSPHNPSLLARRQQHLAFDASTELELPTHGGLSAGLVAFHDETHWYYLGVRRVGNNTELFLEKRAGRSTQIVARTTFAATSRLQLKISANAGAYSFAYAVVDDDWQWLQRDADGTILSTQVAGGFVGTMLGLYARAEPVQ